MTATIVVCRRPPIAEAGAEDGTSVVVASGNRGEGGGGYGFTIHGSAAVPVPLMAVVPEVREMAGRTPTVPLT